MAASLLLMLALTAVAGPASAGGAGTPGDLPPPAAGRPGGQSSGVQVLEARVARAPGDPRSRALLGAALLGAGQSDRAVEELRWALLWGHPVDPADPRGPMFLLAIGHLMEGRLEESLGLYDALRQRGADVERLMAGHTYMQSSRRLQDARRGLERAAGDAARVPRPRTRAGVGAALAVLGADPEALARARVAYAALTGDDRRLLARLEATLSGRGQASPQGRHRRGTPGVGAQRTPGGGSPEGPTLPDGPGSSRGDRGRRSFRFVEASAAAGLDFRHGARPPALSILQVMGSGLALLDLDGDGLEDVVFADEVGLAPCPTRPLEPFLSAAGPRPRPAPTGDLCLARVGARGPGARLFRGVEASSFEDATVPSGVRGPARGMGVLAVDLDADGHDDLVLAGEGEVVVLHNRGDGTFGPWPGSLPVPPRRWYGGVTAGDVTGDGRLDIYLSAYLDLDPSRLPIPRPGPGQAFDHLDGFDPRQFPGLPGVLWASSADGGFADATSPELEERPMKGLGALVTDLDADGLCDLVCINDTSGNRVLLGHPTGALTDATRRAWQGGVHGSMGVDVADVDGDGRLDLVVTNWWDEGTQLLLQRRTGRLFDAGAEAGLRDPTTMRVGWGIRAIDLDGDGDCDVVQVNGHTQRTDFAGHGVLGPRNWPDPQPIQVFENTGGGRFIEASGGTGLEVLERCARGLVAGDLDADGRPDLLVTGLGECPALFLNRTTGGTWLWVDLVGTVSHRTGWGAVVTLEDGGPRSKRRQVQPALVRPSYLSSERPRLIFGRAGGTAGPGRLVVRWPSGSSELHEVPAEARRVRLVEGLGRRL